MKQDHYRQCTFKSGTTSVVAWGSEKGVKVGAEVAFESEPDRWWEVMSVGTSRITKQNTTRNGAVR